MGRGKPSIQREMSERKKMNNEQYFGAGPKSCSKTRVSGGDDRTACGWERGAKSREKGKS